MCIVLSDFFLQMVASNSTLVPSIVSTVHDNTSNISTTLGVAVTTAAGLIGKHLYDSRKGKENLTTAADINIIQQKDIADNYDDFTQSQSDMELFLSMIMSNKDSKISEVLDMIIDSITKETLGQRMIKHCRDIQKYNTEYYKNLSFTPSSSSLSKNPLENTKNLIKDSVSPS